ncbi:MAG TPA: hypothetical protein VEB64_10275, partial [Azospirillaceae bacterium]|nr:hypothetical protein [Azospirillaceae bacterium]
IFQIWILTDAPGHDARWESRAFPKESRDGALVPLASGRRGYNGSGALRINQDAAVLGATVLAGHRLEHAFEPGRHGYLVPAKGRLKINGQEVKARDGVAITGEERVVIEALEDSEVLLADVPSQG